MVFNFPKWHSLNRNNSRGYFKWHKSKRKLAQFDRNQWHKYSENTGTNRTKIATSKTSVIFVDQNYQIFDILGRKISYGKVENNEVDVETLFRGTYILKIFDRNNTLNTKTTKFIKQ